MQNLRQKVSSNTIDVRPQSHNLMKFMNDKNTKQKRQGIRCQPKQLFGVSHDSPDHFKAKNTLIADYGYSYQYDNKKNNNFQYYSQKHFINLGISEKEDPTNKNFNNEYNSTINKNKVGFHKRKGRLSEFMDKNGWMKETYKIMGDQRNEHARCLSNRQRQSRIQTKNQFLSTQKKSMRSTFRKTDPHPKHKDMIQMLMSEKLKIRKMRNEFATIQKDEQKNLRGVTAPSKFNETTNSLRLENGKSKQLGREAENPERRINWMNKKSKEIEDLERVGSKLMTPISSAFSNRRSKQLANY